MSIRDLPDKWRDDEENIGGVNFFRSGYDCAKELQAALPKWTRITDVNNIPKDECRFKWAWFSQPENNWVISIGVGAGFYYLQEKSVPALYYTLLCDLDFPPDD